MLNIYQLEQRIQSAMREHAIVGLALAIVEGAEVTYARGFGVTSVEDGGLPVTPHTLFCVGSISKTVTATLVMRRKLSTFVNELIQGGLIIDQLIEGDLDTGRVRERDAAPDKWYSVPRARLMPTTFIVQARKPHLR